MSEDLEQRIRHALAVRAEQVPVAERDWAPTGLEEPAIRPSGGGVGGRSGRRQLVLGFATVLAAVATLAAAFGATGVLDGDRKVSVANQPSEANGPCGPTGSRVTAEEAAAVRYLPSWLPPGRKITDAFVRAEPVDTRTGTRFSPCFTAPTALVLIDTADKDPSRVDRAAVLTGPSDVPDFVGNGPVQEPIQVRGVTGTLVRMTAGPDVPAAITRRDGFFDTMQLIWSEPDGSSWHLQATHLSKEELVSMAEGLVLDAKGEGPPATAPDPPAGYAVAWQLAKRPDPTAAVQPTWDVRTTQKGDGGELYVRITRRVIPRPAIATAGAGVIQEVRLVQVRGRAGMFIGGSLLWDEGGLSMGLQGNEHQDINTLVQIAESLTPVPADDPRLLSFGRRHIRWLLVPVAIGLAVVTVLLGWKLRRHLR